LRLWFSGKLQTNFKEDSKISVPNTFEKMTEKIQMTEKNLAHRSKSPKQNFEKICSKCDICINKL